MSENTQTGSIAEMPSKRKGNGNTGAAPKIRYLHDKFPGMSQGAIAKRTGVSRQAVSQVLERYLAGIPEDELRQYQASSADIFDTIAHRSLLSITEDKLAKANALQLTTIAAIATDKSRVINGQATTINVSVLMDVVQAMRDRPPTTVNRGPIGEVIAAEVPPDLGE